jgi:hypothetical protein
MFRNLPLLKTGFIGLIYADVELINLKDEMLVEEGFRKEDTRKTSVRILADGGAIRLTINEEIKQQLGLRRGIDLTATLADGLLKTIESGSGIKVLFKDRTREVDTFVMPGNAEPLLGAVPRELMDLALMPAEQKLDYNPNYSNGSVFHLK